MNARTKALLTEYARRNAEMMFIDASFLQDMNVSSSECDIFPMVAQILEGFMKLKPSEQARIQLLGVGMEPQLAQFTFEGLRKQELLDEINAIKL